MHVFSRDLCKELPQFPSWESEHLTISSFQPAFVTSMNIILKNIKVSSQNVLINIQPDIYKVNRISAI